MTANKLGSYSYPNTEAYKPMMTVTKQPVSDKKLLYERVCIVSLVGTSKPDKLCYILENVVHNYEFKITDKTEHLEDSTNLLLLSLNRENLVPGTNY